MARRDAGRGLPRHRRRAHRVRGDVGRVVRPRAGGRRAAHAAAPAGGVLLVRCARSRPLRRAEVALLDTAKGSLKQIIMIGAFNGSA